MRKISIFFLFLLAPLIAVIMAALSFPASSEALNISTKSLEADIKKLDSEINDMGNNIFQFTKNAKNQESLFNQQDVKLTELSVISSEQKQLSDDIYEQKILDMLGPAVYKHLSDRTEIKIFKLKELGYRGFIAKVKLFDPKAFKVVLAQDKLGELETTSSAAVRTNAILAINGGGFYKELSNGKEYAKLIGNTVIDGKLVEVFNGYPGNLFFAGINKKGQVIGTVPQNAADIFVMDPYQGVSFIPVLIKEGEKKVIPDNWKKTKQPRTIIGKYANDDLIMLVIDGRQNDWSVGITLERLQDKLLELGVKDAYNLDGGGSSIMYFNGSILNRPSDGKERKVGNNIVILP